MKKTLFNLLAISVLFACSPDEDSSSTKEPKLGEARMKLTVDLLADTDVAQIHYSITGVDCVTGELLEPAYTAETIKDLEDLVLPGENLDMVGRPFDASSEHLFADAFFWLPEGCYDVATQPITEAGDPSSDCALSLQSMVPVFDGEVTEIILINQCENEVFGGLDAISALNHAPQILGVAYDPSKFTCDDVTTICVTISDPDSDPMVSVWSPVGEGLIVDSINEEANEDGSLLSCATVKVEGPGDYFINFALFDQAYDAEGNLVHIEELLALQGSEATSNDTIMLPIHAMSEDACVGECACPEGFEINAAGDLCERITTTDAIFNGELTQVCRGSINANYGAWGALFPKGTEDRNAFFGEDFGDENGSRLNTIGIWACDAEGNQTVEPTLEWVGFSRCLEIEEGGSYLIGIAADNWMRAKVNGQTFFFIDANNESDDLHPYRHWHMIPVTLPAGTNIIELEGMNAGGPAAFAAEIYGPFNPEAMQDDASMIALDYENNVIWNTGDQIGSQFNTGTNSGWACEEGYALDLCGDEVTCTLIERLLCE